MILRTKMQRQWGGGKDSIMEILGIIYFRIECLFKDLKKTKILNVLGILKYMELPIFFWNNSSDP